MSLIIATGSNLGCKEENLLEAKQRLSQHFLLIAESRIYESDPVDFLDQPPFLNQVLEFQIPNDLSPSTILSYAQKIESDMGRKRVIPRGPRPIDIDILFLGLNSINLPNLIIPHPRWMERSFVVNPLQELPYAQILKNHFSFPSHFSTMAYPLA